MNRRVLAAGRTSLRATWLAAAALAVALAPRCTAPMNYAAERALRAERLRRARSWEVHYRDGAAPAAPDTLLVNDPDTPGASEVVFGDAGLRIGYLSVGEVNARLPMVRALRREGALEGENPDWPGAYYGRLAHPAWFAEYLRPRMAQIASAGFEGLFLDTLDSALAGRGWARGRHDALRETAALVRAIRREHPAWLIVPNGGLALRTELRGQVDGWAVEDVFSGYDWGQRTYRPTPPERQRDVLAALHELRASGLPVFVLDYVAPGHADVAAAVRRRCESEGFRCTVSSIELP
jgi:endo-alpha-1,4-polygalactosaminidase (GH114 family)